MGFFSELKRRNVARMAALYAVTAWLIMQVAEVVIGLALLLKPLGIAGAALIQQQDVGLPLLDTTVIHAQAALALALGE